MSLVGDLKRSSTLETIAKRLANYEAIIEAGPEAFKLDGKNLEQAVKDHAFNLANYDQCLQECKTIEEFMKGKLDRVEADLHKHYLENSQRALGARDLAMYIRGDEKFSEVNQVLMEVAHIRRQLESIVEALQSLGWSLSNIVKLRIASLDGTVL